MAVPARDRRVAWHAQGCQLAARRGNSPAVLRHREEALYSADCFACLSVRRGVPVFLVQHGLILLAYRESLLCHTLALPPDARMGRAPLVILLARGAQRFCFVPREAI